MTNKDYVKVKKSDLESMLWASVRFALSRQCYLCGMLPVWTADYGKHIGPDCKQRIREAIRESMGTARWLPSDIRYLEKALSFLNEDK